MLDISIRHVGGTRENRFSESEFAVQIGLSRISQTVRIDHLCRILDLVCL